MTAIPLRGTGGSRVKQVYTESTPKGHGVSTIPYGYDVTNYYFFGGAYGVEVNGATTTITRYYAIGGQTVAMYDGANLRYLITDHLGSVIAVANASGGLVSQQRFLPFGQLRGTTTTRY